MEGELGVHRPSPRTSSVTKAALVRDPGLKGVRVDFRKERILGESQRLDFHPPQLVELVFWKFLPRLGLLPSFRNSEGVQQSCNTDALRFLHGACMGLSRERQLPGRDQKESDRCQAATDSIECSKAQS